MGRCANLNELPSPPLGKTGWPWTEASPQLPDTMPNGSPWPKITIVTPSFNQGQFIEETIRSVILQAYPNLEYIVIDGRSTDQSVEIIRKYEKWLTYWVSQPDEGQTHAINKGFKKATGEMVAWLNSDDIYMAEALAWVGKLPATHPEVDLIYGNMLVIDEEGKVIQKCTAREFNLADQICCRFIYQPTCFWRSRLFKKIGYLDERYQYIFDLEYWIRAGFHVHLKYFPIFLACFRIHAGAKTQLKHRREAHELITFYETLFTHPKVPTQVLASKPRLLAHFYELLALRYLEEGLYLKARRSYWRAILFTPWRLQNLTLMASIIDTFLHTHFGRAIQRLSKTMRDRLGSTVG